ncbi:c4-dicarboxylate transporter malic acid transport [Pyrrhoderma noxium]|uniref:C4-dicarboxylate transporter malic acid transport n=1 Tax=Pyrrhoderma noxium TaxID=2282107 RepID=A0A286UCJ0_9AGAM|nr:c4-dicarboxylate transporter malic acid transport [Pyrrhoderma noxium]
MPLGSQKSRKSLRERVRHFTPAWHAVNTGTGAVAALFHVFPYGSNHSGMQYTALSFELLNLFFFVVLTAIGLARYTFFRGVWASMLRHPVQSLFLGCFPMGLSNLIVGAVGTIHGYFNFGGTGFLYTLWGLWWADVVMSMAICFGQLHIMFTRQSHEVHLMSLIWLLPIVTMVVAASAGVDSQSERYSLSLYLQFIPTVSSFMDFPREFQSFPLFFPSVLLARLVSNIFADDIIPRFIYFCAWMLAFAMWSFATFWFLLAILALGDTPRLVSLPFTIMFWGTLFPNGAYARLTIILANSFDSTALRIWGSIYSCFVFALWIFSMSRSVIPFWDGSLFEAADLIEPEEAELIGMDPLDKEQNLAQVQTRSTTPASTIFIAEAI